MMEGAFLQASRVLKSNGEFVIVYAHKTTLGWATLVEALRRSGFVVVEAWPLDTEMKTRLIAMDTAALASSIFLVARKRDANAGTGSYETDVRPELERIVRERVQTLWEMEIMGADLVIACVGAGLRAFTRYGRVEFANGEEAPAERFLTEVETVVLETVLDRLSKEAAKTAEPAAKANGKNGRKNGHGQDAHATSLAGVDPATRFYILWRYTFRSAELDAGEAIIFANGTHVELDGAHGLCAGGRALVEKKKSKYRLLDYTERGDDAKLGLPGDPSTGSGQGTGQAVPLVDVLHRMLWLMVNRPAALTDYLQEARPNLEQVRLAAQALAGPALKGGGLADVSPGAELAALGRLTSNWRSLTEGMGPLLSGKGGTK
jgi:putative DNA methylase